MNDYDDLQLLYIWRTLKAWKTLVLIIVVISVVTTGIAYMILPKRYQTQAKINLSNISLYVPDQLLDPVKDEKMYSDYSMISFIDFAQSDKVLKETLAQTGSHKNIVEMRDSVQIAKGEQDTSMTVIITANDPKKAGLAANHIAESLVARIKSVDEERREVLTERLRDISSDLKTVKNQLKILERVIEELTQQKGANDQRLLAEAQAVSAFADLEKMKASLTEADETLTALISNQGNTYLSQKASSSSAAQGRSLLFNLTLSAIVSFFAGLFIALIAEYIKQGGADQKARAK